MSARFDHEGLPGRVLFGAGRVAEIAEVIGDLGLARVLVIASGSQGATGDDVAAALGDHVAGRIDGAAMHVPVAVAKAAIAKAEACSADGVIAIGGGSATGLAKAIARASGVAVIAVPTTYAGSEMTAIWGETEGGRKRTGRDPRVLPRVVIYDPDLLAGLPAKIAGTSGMNAIAHAVEALYAPAISRLVLRAAEDAVALLAEALPASLGGDGAARARALEGAWLAGWCLGTAGTALHHKLCHVLGGSFDLPHAPTHAVVLPHAVAYNRNAAPDAMMRLERVLGGGDPARALFDLGRKLDVPKGLFELGFRVEDVELAVAQAMEASYPNPRPLERDGLRRLLEDALHGRPPAPA